MKQNGWENVAHGNVVSHQPRSDESVTHQKAPQDTLTADRAARGNLVLSRLTPATQQVVGDAFVRDGDSSSRAPSLSVLSAALFATCLASQSGDAAAVLHLLKFHGDGVEEVRDENGRTPLHHVCRADDVGLVRLLCQAGADDAAQDCQVRRG